jgi:hypothetical protein
VQAGRLRAKLSEYYNSNGVDDPIVVELPKGTYVLSFHHRLPNTAKQHSVPVAESDWNGARPQHGSRNWVIAAVSLALLLVASAAVILLLVANRNSAHAGVAHDGDVAPAAFRVFWNGFISGPEEPWVIFSNAKFIGRPEIALRYYDARKDGDRPIFDHYTGVGEVIAVHELDYLFGTLHRQIRVKRGSLFSLDDAKNNNLIFVGSPLENLTLLEIPGTQEFVFHRVESGTRKGDPEIINMHPQPGEPKEFLGTPSDVPLTEDYAVIGLVKGLNPGQAVLILAGNTTIGTQAAVEFVCRQNSVEELLLRLPVSENGQLRPFEVVLRVKVTRGVPVGTELVALHSGTS